jgi:hypothetical protein
MTATNVEEFLRTGMVPNPMGVSGQAGKPRPEVGVLLREGSEVRRDSATGGVLAEILLRPSAPGEPNGLVPVLATFTSPWPLASGTAFDVECRDPRTGDGAFLQVSSRRRASDDDDALLSDAFLVEQLASPTGRFALYGAPTDVKVRDSRVVVRGPSSSSSSSSSSDGASGGGATYKVLDVSFSLISQSTQAELPRRAIVAATVPKGTGQAVLLVASSSASRWTSRGIGDAAARAAESFVAVPAPPTRLAVRAKGRR